MTVCVARNSSDKANVVKIVTLLCKEAAQLNMWYSPPFCATFIGVSSFFSLASLSLNGWQIECKCFCQKKLISEQISEGVK
jgi:hypothetical protein